MTTPFPYLSFRPGHLATLSAVGLIGLSSVAHAKGPGVTLSHAVVGVEFAWNEARPGETVPLRARLDIAAACSAPDAVWFQDFSCESSATTCVAALEEARWRDGLTIAIGIDGGGFEVPVTLESCGTSAGPALCGELVFPPFAPAGVWTTVQLPERAPLALGKGLVSLTSDDGDVERPTLLAVAMPVGAVPPSEPGMEVLVRDDHSGVVEGVAWLEPLGSDGKPSDGKVLDAVLRCGPPDAEGVARCRGERPLRDRGWLNAAGDDWAPVPADGRWYLRSLRLRDRLGRSTYWEPPELALGGGAGLSKYAISVAYAAGTVKTRATVWALEETDAVDISEPTSPGDGTEATEAPVFEADEVPGSTDEPLSAGEVGSPVTSAASSRAAAGCSESPVGTGGAACGLTALAWLLARRAFPKGRLPARER